MDDGKAGIEVILRRCPGIRRIISRSGVRWCLGQVSLENTQIRPGVEVISTRLRGKRIYALLKSLIWAKRLARFWGNWSR